MHSSPLVISPLVHILTSQLTYHPLVQPPPLMPSHHWCTYIIVTTPLVHLIIGALAHIIVPTPPICTFTTISTPNHWCTYTHLFTVHHPLVHLSPLVHIRTSLIGAHTHILVIRLPSLGHPELLVVTDTTLFKGNFVVAFILRLYSPSIETARASTSSVKYMYKMSQE